MFCFGEEVLPEDMIKSYQSLMRHPFSFNVSCYRSVPVRLHETICDNTVAGEANNLPYFTARSNKDFLGPRLTFIKCAPSEGYSLLWHEYLLIIEHHACAFLA